MNCRIVLSRPLGMGAATVVTTVLPATADARPQLALVPSAPVEPTVPPVLPWRTTYPELAGHIDRLLAALPHLDLASGRWPAHWLTGMTGAIANLAEGYAGLREPEPRVPFAPRRTEPEQEYAKLVDSSRIVLVRTPRQSAQERRRVPRWLTARSTGQDSPIVHLRLGQRNAVSGERGFDFLDVAAPGWSERSPFGHGQRVAEEYQHRFGPV